MFKGCTEHIHFSLIILTVFFYYLNGCTASAFFPSKWTISSSLQCLNLTQLLTYYGLNPDSLISPSQFTYLCPALLYQIDSRVCIRHYHQMDVEQEALQPVSPGKSQVSYWSGQFWLKCRKKQTITSAGVSTANCHSKVLKSSVRPTLRLSGCFFLCFWKKSFTMYCSSEKDSLDMHVRWFCSKTSWPYRCS